ncbi:MAG: AraC family transcriptional regulator [Leptolyngbya sp. SIO1D8]|nr:AraC family transcriptional regulator [Leptolyngbya sp. SIO1D8]
MSELSYTIHDKFRGPRIRTSIVANTFNYAVGCGLDARQIISEIGLTRADLIDPRTRLPEETVPTIWNLLDNVYPGRALALHMASAAPFSFFGPLALGVQYARDLRSALQLLVQYGSVLFDQVHTKLIESDSEAIFCSDHPVDAIYGGYGAEVALALASRLLQAAIGERYSLARVEFTHRPLGLRQVYEDFFEVPVRFQQAHNALVFCQEALALSTRQYDADLFHHVQETLDSLHSDDAWVSGLKGLQYRSRH